MKLSTSRLIKKFSLGVQVCDNLTWHQNSSTRASKTLKALWYLRRNLHHRTLPQVKLNAYKGYIVPIIPYACQVWYPSECDLVLIERIQKSATKWIIGSSLTYKENSENSTSIFFTSNFTAYYYYVIS